VTGMKSLMTIALVGSVTCFFSWPAAAAADTPVHLGGYGGMNLATIGFSPDLGAAMKFRPTMQVGALVDYTLNPKVSVGCGLAFSMKGYEAEWDGVDMNGYPTTWMDTRKFNYVMVPIKAKLRMKTSGALPYVHLGPELGILLSAKANNELWGPGETDVKNDMKTMDACLAGGAGVEVPVRGRAGFLELGYELGLLNVYRDTDVKMRTRNLYLVLGLKI
jgi:hypothetical protein